MKISIFISRYGVTGVPLAQAKLARGLSKRGFDVDLIIGSVEKGVDLPKISNVSIILLNKLRVRYMFWFIVKYLYQKSPDVIFSAEDHLNALLLLGAVVTRIKSKISCSSRVNPFDTYSGIIFSKKWFLKHFIKLVWWRADVLTCVSNAMVEQYKQLFPSAKHVCVYNIVNDEYSRISMHEENLHPWTIDRSIPLIIAAGQLAHWKGFNYLIDAVSLLIMRRNVRLLILGEGPLRSVLEAQINNLGLSFCVQLIGHVRNPFKYYSNADVFVLSSLVEGLPNVLVEAMLCGCTPVATDCETGPKEVLRDGKYGYLVPVQDSSALAAAIELALDNPINKFLLNEATNAFHEDVIIDRHFKLLSI